MSKTDLIRLGRLIWPAKSKRAGNRNLPILSMTMHFGLIDQESKFKKRVASADTSAYKVVAKNQLVVGFPIDEGVLSIQKQYDEAIVSPAYDVWDVDQTQVDPIYLEKFLRSPKALSFYSSKLRGSTARRRTLPDDIFLSLQIPICKIEDQMHGLDILSKAEELIAGRRQSLDLIDRLIQSHFIDMFGDPATNPKNWMYGTLSDVCTQITDGEHQTPKRQSDGVKLLSARNVQDGFLDFSNVDYVDEQEYARISKRCDPKLGDILMSCSGSIGRVAPVLTTEPFCLVRSAALLKPNHEAVDTSFLVELLRTPYLKSKMLQRANSSSQANLFQNQIRELPIFQPPLVLQHQFSNHMERIRHTKSAYQLGLKQSLALFGSLQSSIFEGPI